MCKFSLRKWSLRSSGVKGVSVSADGHAGYSERFFSRQSVCKMQSQSFITGT